MVVKTFRGLLVDGGQDRIRLQTIKGKVGYRIAKFEVIDQSPGTNALESVVKIYKSSQSSIDAIVDFTDSDLLAMAYFTNNTSTNYASGLDIIFDNEIFNQDIYISSKDATGNANAMNYYLELEVIPLDDKGAEYTTIKYLRTRGL